MSFRDPESITVEEYAKLFSESRFMSYKSVDFLRQHLKFPRFTATMGELAKAVGMATFTAANNHYGVLAKMLAMEFGWTEADKRSGCFGDWLGFLATGSIQDFPPYHFCWTLRKNVVLALRDLGWSVTGIIAL